MILVTGATGHVGAELVQQLLEAGQPVRVFTRDARKVAHLEGRVEVAVGDLDKPETLESALQGVDRLFLVTGRSDQDSNAIDAARRAGVEQIVKLSTLEASDHILQIGKWHYEKEELLRASGLAWTLLRPGMYMSNAVDWWASAIKSQRPVFFPGGEGRTAPIDPYDIAVVAAVTLTQPGHEGKAYELTGPDLVSVGEMLEIIGRVLGRPIQYVDIPPDEAKAFMLKGGMDKRLVEAFMETLTALRENRGAKLTDTVRQVTGHSPHTFETWCRAHIAAFQ